MNELDKLAGRLVASLGREKLNGKHIYSVHYKKEFFTVIARDFMIETVGGEKVLLLTQAWRIKIIYINGIEEFKHESMDEADFLVWRIADIDSMYRII